MNTVKRPALEGSVAVRHDRRLSFAEYGNTRGPALVWMHGTPGARRQIPLEARVYAEEHGLRIIGIDRPGIGSSTPYLYPNLADWTHDLEILLDTLGVDTVRVIGLSGVGPTPWQRAPGWPTEFMAWASSEASPRPRASMRSVAASSSSPSTSLRCWHPRGCRWAWP